MATTNNIVMGVWVVNPSQEAGQIPEYLALIFELTSLKVAGAGPCVWQWQWSRNCANARNV